ncbi:Proton extrusion protein PcxA [Planktothrix tepida]|uniref:Proton extrusion protein PxcA n=1 Tax=Planktothrix tepida PCC 9214 TaxID=671072 RepID=A0A1J1LQL7_9CYAN|nr:hypothetical protein [Planktothrix tepida]CAD5963144.1 Proton extrusion protein PcxA [Planktothrix tepida]CUR34869.1 Proton extrusion protein PcxA [Planktothrix tepida PCC 9214]
MSNSIIKFQKGSLGARFLNVFKSSNQWVHKTPERALEQAYQAALAIKAIEDQHFGGQKVSEDAPQYTPSVLECFINDVEKHLNTIKFELSKFKFTRNLDNSGDIEFIEKLKFIDDIVDKYQYNSVSSHQTLSSNTYQFESVKRSNNGKSNPSGLSPLDFVEVEASGEVFNGKKSGALPRSIGRTFKKIQTELDDSSEEQLMNSYRASRKKTKSAVNFLLMLILIPLLAQQLSKNFIFFPLVEHYRQTHEVPLFLNSEMKEEALHELKSYEEELQLASLLYKTPTIEREEIEKKMEEKAEEISKEFDHKSSEAISNLFADFVGLIAFALVIILNPQGLAALKSLLNTVMYDLSDSAKAFIIILITDIFVGFHSPHGWEVLLEGFSSHFGIAPNRSFIFLFIATFPVILDTIMKYWIFRYLSRISPSAVATLRNMNE